MLSSSANTRMVIVYCTNLDCFIVQSIIFILRLPYYIFLKTYINQIINRYT